LTLAARRAPRDRCPHRGRRPHHRRGVRGPDRGHAEDSGRGWARLRRALTSDLV